jgi:hypothetical protein
MKKMRIYQINGILLYVLGGVQKNKQKIIFEKIYPGFKEIFFKNNEK